jgi:hypothetical protein
LGLAQVLPAYGSKFLLPATILTFLWLVYAALSQWRLLRNYEATNREAFFNSFPYAFVAFVLCPFLFYSAIKDEPRPHTHISLLTGSTIQDRLALTNRFLVFPANFKGDIVGKMSGVIVAPVPSNNAAATLRLLSFNDSPAPVEALTTTVFFLTNLVCTPEKPDPGGQPWETNVSLLPAYQMLSIRSQRVWLPYEQGICPSLSFHINEGWTFGPVPILILVQAKHMEHYYVAFWLSCPVMKNPTPPRFTLAKHTTDGELQIHFDLPQDP